jgi:hypothetical protein
MPKFEVELNMFLPGTIRVVTVPRSAIREHIKNKQTFEILEKVFYYGQNDFQPQELPSVSAGDVIRFKDERFMVLSLGFRKLKENEYINTRPKLEDVFQIQGGHNHIKK